ncbi:hypothetical protein SEA_GERALT_40 [Mycobacterium phage Geralt]|uniref:Helix-turn-helix domain-containing protein n=3 Tax=Cheoctovirus TaxID=1623281 RepID=A0A2K9VE31_9CAUD|nr:gp43 [Mycobacterium phage Ramsey]YP_009960726.1 hypothetical protein I5H73_gp040 [Mycobacterium phage OldBen]YP_010092510.1 hypothetical protein KNT74_gp40 [Mycobacterium phage Geralt]AXQ61680.1 excise [Mycobacterium phage Nimbo]AXQ61841.1 excise [Mycobacterium phage PHappiness]QEQ94438.1 excise [Mycobacterium phage KingMidas]WNM65209.1 hypothetical protein SEA_STAP_41 [Mycobacterium phage Stap]WNT44497.1 DNA binding protein [Mycobacterium phage BlueCrab]
MGDAPTPRRFVKLAEAAAYLDVTPRTIRQMIADGRLTGYRAGARRHAAFRGCGLDAETQKCPQLLTAWWL